MTSNRAKRHHVRLRKGTSESVVEVYAETPGQAAGMAEATDEIGQSVAVACTTFTVFIGRCARCRVIIEQGQHFQTLPGKKGTPIRFLCGDCGGKWK